MKPSEYYIYLTGEGLVELTTFGCPPPTSAPFNKFPTVYGVQSGRTVGDGLPEVVWEWDIMPARAWHVLLDDALSREQSVETSIITLDPDSNPEAYSEYTAVAHRPPVPRDGRHVMGRMYKNVKIKFTCVEASP